MIELKTSLTVPKKLCDIYKNSQKYPVFTLCTKSANMTSCLPNYLQNFTAFYFVLFQNLFTTQKKIIFAKH